jgi:hypothetical protein
VEKATFVGYNPTGRIQGVMPFLILQQPAAKLSIYYNYYGK